MKRPFTNQTLLQEQGKMFKVFLIAVVLLNYRQSMFSESAPTPDQQSNQQV